MIKIVENPAKFQLRKALRQLERERQQTSPDWERYDHDNELSLEMEEV